MEYAQWIIMMVHLHTLAIELLFVHSTPLKVSNWFSFIFQHTTEISCTFCRLNFSRLLRALCAFGLRMYAELCTWEGNDGDVLHIIHHFQEIELALLWKKHVLVFYSFTTIADALQCGQKHLYWKLWSHNVVPIHWKEQCYTAGILA